MIKQTARNNEFLKYVKVTYNTPTFKGITKLVNEGKEKLAKFMVDTQLYWYLGGQEVAEKLINMNYQYKGNETITELFEIAEV